MDGWRDPKSGRWVRKDWAAFEPLPEERDMYEIIGPDIAGLDPDDRLFRLGEIPSLREEAAPSFWVYWRWKRFGLQYFLICGPEPREVVPAFLVDRIATIDSIMQGGEHG